MQLILTTPTNIKLDQFLPLLQTAVQTGKISVLIVCRHDLNDQEYADLVRSLAPVAQEGNCAVLLENLPDKVRDLNVDGVHMTSGHTKFSQALEDLKPDFIVGAGDLSSRHEIMLRAEAGADYVMFGSFEEAPNEQDIELAGWSVEMLEVPTAVADPITLLADIDPVGAEFFALGDNFWQVAQTPATQTAIDALLHSTDDDA